MRHSPRTSGRRPRRGIALIAVLVVVAVLALAAYRFSELMQGEYNAADSYARAIQARSFADSGINYAAVMLASPDPTVLNGNPYDNTSLFQGQVVQNGATARQRGRFHIISPADPDSASGGVAGAQNYRFGVTDECGKININALFALDSSGTVLYNALMLLPNMTDDIANAIIDWIDPDDTPRSNGAEEEYYSTLQPAYHCKNGPLDSIEELLYVKGVTPELLFGNDTNRTGIADPNDPTGIVDLGWKAYLTVYSRELNIDSQGNPRIYVNDADLTDLSTNLSNGGFDDSVTAFILAVRMYGVTSASSGGAGSSGGSGNSGGSAKPSTPSSGGSASSGAAVSGVATLQSGSGGLKISITLTPAASTSSNNAVKASGPLTVAALGDLSSQQGGQKISSIYSLINATVTVPATTPNSPSMIYSSPLSDAGSIKQYLPQMLDQLTTSKSSTIPARVNVLTAPSAVLTALPNLDATTVGTITSTRPSLSSGDAPDPIFQTPAWLITEAQLPVSTVQSLDKYVTSRSQVYRIQSVGTFDSGGPTVRIEAVIDTNAGRPRIVYYRDLTGLGKGFDLPKN